MERRITFRDAPPMGDIRTMTRGDTIWLSADAQTRPDWARYSDALSAAVSRGAEIRRKWES